MPIWPASGRATAQPGIASASARAEAGGTMRSPAGIIACAGTATAPGSTGQPPSVQAPRAGRFSPYQPTRHSCATGAASGTPSLSQSSSATKARARAESGSIRAKAANLRRASNGSSPANSACTTSVGSRPPGPSDGAIAAPVRPSARACPARPAWKSHGVASSDSRSTGTAGPAKPAASGRARSPPMQ